MLGDRPSHDPTGEEVYQWWATNELNDQRVAFLVSNEGTEQVELTEPWQAIEAAGGTPVLVAPEGGDIQAFNHLDKGDTFPVDEEIVVDDAGPNVLVTSRKPDDLDAFCRATVRVLAGSSSE